MPSSVLVWEHPFRIISVRLGAKGNQMARTVRNPKIDTRSARAKLPGRREPYWTVLSAGCALGYRKGVKGGTWIARFRSDDGLPLAVVVGFGITRTTTLSGWPGWRSVSAQSREWASRVFDG